MEPEQQNMEEEESTQTPIDIQIAPEDILEEIILDDNDNIVPDDLDEDDSEYIPEEDVDSDDIVVEGEAGPEELDAVEENLEVPMSKLLHAGVFNGSPHLTVRRSVFRSIQPSQPPNLRVRIW